MTAKEMVCGAVKALDDHKAKDIQVIGITEVTSIGDYFVIAEGNSTTQVRALADYVETLLEERGALPLRKEGEPASGWVLLDYGQIIVHIFTQETRRFYDLERLWKDGEQCDYQEFLEDEE